MGKMLEKAAAAVRNETLDVLASGYCAQIASAVIEALREPSEAVIAALLNPETPYIARLNKMNPDGKEYEVIKQTNANWRTTITDDQEIMGQFATRDENDALFDELTAKYRWNAVIDAIRTGKAPESTPPLARLRRRL